MKTPYAQKTAKRSTPEGVFAKRYANYNDGSTYVDPSIIPDARPAAPIVASGSTSGAAKTSGSSSGASFWNILTSVTNDVFGLLSLKQVTTQSLSEDSKDIYIAENKAKQTRAIILGLVAIALVVGAVLVMKKK